VFIKHTNNEQQFKHQTTMKNLIYTTTEINKNFRIKVFGIDETGKKVNKLMGVSGAMRLVGDIKIFNNLLDRAFSSMDDVCVCKLRRGVKVSFYVK
jgi:hypothetical protein